MKLNDSGRREIEIRGLWETGNENQTETETGNGIITYTGMANGTGFFTNGIGIEPFFLNGIGIETTHWALNIIYGSSDWLIGMA